MRYQLPEKVAALTAYQPIEGQYPVRLDANESPYPIGAHAKSDMLERIAKASLNRYPDPYATECCMLMAELSGVSPRQVVAGNGSDELLALLTSCMLGRGAKIAVFSEDFSMYRLYAALGELSVVMLKKTGDLQIDVGDTIETLEREQVSLLLFSNPCNPTSQILKRAEVERLLKGTGALVVVDEAYMDFTPEETVIPLVGEYENLLVLKTCSKAVGIAGVRMGFALGPVALIDAIRAVKSPYNVNVLTQCTVAAVLSDREYLTAAAAGLRESALWLYNALVTIGEAFPGVFQKIYRPSGNFLYLITQQATPLQQGLLKKGIAIRGFSGALRISAGTEAENRALVEGMRALLEQEGEKA